ncbi:DeoR/GlpR family DNA-binding transcription regulator [Paenibacillus koleovorans]|uniref:DeoR/GlpR family DNA-binding transcription regulator n=1 Tax=Paenibacillus koleovorans TaxID=121608 RepID=UPI000FDB8C5E|nr:DeoR/GlpR family DNA-binding transcription regulator [Paenibacillus koleovorans]
MSVHSLSKGEQRRDAIVAMLKQKGRISVQDIVDTLHCSEATARRDLDLLEKTEGIIRTIGGALYDAHSPVREVSFQEKTSLSWLEKERIAATAASLVEDGDVIGLSGGTTTYHIARALKSRRGITVVTNAINIAMELADSEDIQVVVAGGILRSKSYELCGPLAEKLIEGLNIGKMFLGIDGVALSQGLTTYSESEAQIAKALIKRSDQTLAVFDRTKVGRTSLFSIAPLTAVHGCITDAPLDPVFRQELERIGVRVHLAE